MIFLSTICLGYFIRHKMITILSQYFFSLILSHFFLYYLLSFPTSTIDDTIVVANVQQYSNLELPPADLEHLPLDLELPPSNLPSPSRRRLLTSFSISPTWTFSCHQPFFFNGTPRKHHTLLRSLHIFLLRFFDVKIWRSTRKPLRSASPE